MSHQKEAMKSLFVILTLIASPIALAQVDPAVPQAVVATPILDQFTAANVRPAKIQVFQNRAADINRRIKLLEEEGKKLNGKANSKFLKNASKVDEFRRRTGNPTDVALRPTRPDSNLEYKKRVAEMQKEVMTFRQEISQEFALRTNELKGYEKTKQGQLKAHQQQLAEQAATLAPTHEEAQRRQKATTQPAPTVAEPVPSSVPGLPPGVEPTKKKQSALPPGMTKSK